VPKVASTFCDGLATAHQADALAFEVLASQDVLPAESATASFDGLIDPVHTAAGYLDGKFNRSMASKGNTARAELCAGCTASPTGPTR
jgi:hypothetical protein